MPGNLNWSDIPTATTGLEQKSDLINAQRGILDAATTEQLDIATDVSDVLTTDEFGDNMAFIIPNANTGAVSLTVPASYPRIFAVVNESAFEVTVIKGLTSLVIEASNSELFYADDTADGLVRATPTEEDIVRSIMVNVYAEGSYSAGEVVGLYSFIDSGNIPTGFTNSIFKLDTATTGAVSFDVQKNGVSIGTIDFAAAATSATFTGGNADFLEGDVLAIVAPNPADGTAAGLHGVLEITVNFSPPVVATQFGFQVYVDPVNVDDLIADFPLVITERDMPAEFWTNGDETTIQAYDETGQTAFDTEVAWFDSVNERCRIHVKVPGISQLAGAVVNVFWDVTPTAAAAVFTMYDIVVPLKVLTEGDVDNYGSESITLIFDEGTGGPLNYTNDGLVFTGTDDQTIKANMTAKNDYYAVVRGRQDDATQKTMMSIHVSSANRANITIDNGNEASAWDSTNGWFDTSPIQDPGTSDFFVIGYKVEDAVERNIWFNGGFKGTDNTISATTDRTAFRIGIAANDAEDWNGPISEARLAGDITPFTDEFVKLEHANLNNIDEYSVTAIEVDNEKEVPINQTNVSFYLSTVGEAPGSQVFHDESANDFAITTTGNTNVQADGSIYFDGNGDWLTVPHDSQISVANSNDMLFEVEFNWDGTGDTTQCFFNKRDGGSAEEFRMTLNGGKIEFITFISGSADVNLIDSSSVSAGTWYNFKAERISGTWTIYLDDVEIASATEAGTPSANGADLQIGRSRFNSAREFKGYIRKAKIVQIP